MNREQWLNNFYSESVNFIDSKVIELKPKYPWFRTASQLKDKIKFSTTAPTRGKYIGLNFKSSCSESKYSEIFISAKINDSMQVAATLIHEVIHSVDDNKSGHRKPFSSLAKLLLLEGKPTATTHSEEFVKHFTPIIDKLGAYPHSKMTLSINIKKQTTRLLKAKCVTCDWSYRITRLQAERGLSSCGACDDKMMLTV